MIIWLTGQPGCGKTTIANALIDDNPLWFNIDGDDLREVMPNPGYDKWGRKTNIDRAQAIAAYLDSQGYHVVVSVVAPYREQRDEFKKSHDVLEVFLHTTEERGREKYHVHDYEPPSSNFVAIDTGCTTVDEAVRTVYREMAALSPRTHVAGTAEAGSRCTCLDSCPRHAH